MTLTFTEWLASLVAGGAVVLGVGVAVTLFLRREGSRAANQALGLLLLVVAAAVLNELVVNVRPADVSWRIGALPLLFTYAVGPLLYAYVCVKVGRGKRVGWGHAVLPVAQALLAVGIFVAPEALIEAYLRGVYWPWYGVVEDVVFTASMAVYLGLSYRVLSNRADAVRFDWERDTHAWLRHLVTGAALVFGVSVVFNVAGLLAGVLGFEVYAYEITAFAENSAYSVLLYWMALNGFVQAIPQARPLVRAPERKEHYNLDAELAATHSAALARLMETERPYLDADLSLAVLAAHLGVTDNVLSYVLNETMGTTYAAYVNGLRVEEAKQRLASPEFAHLSVLGVGLDAGFRSKATFNRMFKQVTGETPSAYRARRRPETS